MGITEGNREEGLKDGVDEGGVEGEAVGADEGEDDGCWDGFSDGLVVGDHVGLDDGAELGAEDGLGVMRDGSADGAVVGGGHPPTKWAGGGTYVWKTPLNENIDPVKVQKVAASMWLPVAGTNDRKGFTSGSGTLFGLITTSSGLWQIVIGYTAFSRVEVKSFSCSARHSSAISDSSCAESNEQGSSLFRSRTLRANST